MKESNLVDGQCFVAPNGYVLVKVFRHGYVKFLGALTDDEKDMIQEMSRIAGEQAKTPAEAFELMGWTQVTDEYEEKLATVAEAFYRDDNYPTYKDAYTEMVSEYRAKKLSKDFINTVYEMNKEAP